MRRRIYILHFPRDVEFETLFSKSVFGSVIAGAFQITFCVKMHINDFFFIFKKLFLRSAHQNDLKRTNYIKPPSKE
jgi:hypothetical protein